MAEFESQLRQKQRNIDQLTRKMEVNKSMGADLTPEGVDGF